MLMSSKRFEEDVSMLHYKEVFEMIADRKIINIVVKILF